MKKMMIASMLLSVGLLAAGSGKMTQNRIMNQFTDRAQTQNSDGVISSGSQYRHQNRYEYRNGSGNSGQGTQMRLRDGSGSGAMHRRGKR